MGNRHLFTLVLLLLMLKPSREVFARDASAPRAHACVNPPAVSDVLKKKNLENQRDVRNAMDGGVRASA